MVVKISDYIADFLVENGIKDVFMITGGGAMHLNDSLGHKEGLTCTFHHHEQACSIAAESYMRLSGRLPAVCVTSGPGGTNALTGVLGAWLDSIPMFVLSGQVKRETTITACPEIPLRQLGDQEFNITECVAPMTKYAKFLDCPEEVPYHLEKALYLCREGRGGPVWLDVPLDIQAAKVDTENMVHFHPSELQPSYPPYDPAVTGQIIERLKTAKRPVILAGTGIRLGNAHAEFLELAERLNIPVVTAWNAHDVIWDAHPLYCGRPGTIGNRGGNFVVQNSDLLISLGCRLNIRQISYSYKEFAKNAYKVIVDIDSAELKKPTVSPDLPVHADVKDVIRSLLDSGFTNPEGRFAQWLAWCRDINAKYPAAMPEYYHTESPVNPYVFMKELFLKLDEGETVVTGNGSACVISFQAAVIKPGQRLYTNSGCATMGYGVPGAIGACVAGGKRVVCLDGDGSLQMNIQELQTIVHHQYDIKIFYLNNDGYHSMRQTQSNLFEGALVGVSGNSGVSFPDMGKIAPAYGIPYFSIRTVDGISGTVQEVLDTKGPAICEVFLDKGQFFAPKLSSKVLPDGTIVSPEIDDLYPFLPRGEYEKNKEISKQ